MTGRSFSVSFSRRILGAILGALIAGLILAVWMLVGEVTSHEPSMLTVMERQIHSWTGAASPDGTASVSEEYIGLTGHLLLSAVAGMLYGLCWRSDKRVILNGLAFGMAFYVVAHGIVGPLLGLMPPMWKEPAAQLLLGVVINAFFGVSTSCFAYQFSARPPASTDRHLPDTAPATRV